MCGRRASHAGSTEPFLGVLRFYSGQEPPRNLEVAPDHKGHILCWSHVIFACFILFYAIYSLLPTSIVQPHGRMTVGKPRLRFSRGGTKSSRPRGFPAMAQAPAANAGEHEAPNRWLKSPQGMSLFSHI